MYILWILPYLQINEYFSHDSYYLSQLYTEYLTRGITTRVRYAFCVEPKHGTQRYSTSLLTAIILTSATSVDINFASWYLYPLIFTTIPFFFYSVFQRYSKNKNDDSKVNLVILTILVLLTPQLVKNGHNTSTGLIGTLVFFILVVEFFNLINESKYKINSLIFILLFYFFLCLTHFEECFYYIVIIFVYGLYNFFLKFREIEDNSPYLHSSDPLKNQIIIKLFLIDKSLALKELKKRHGIIGIFFFTISLVFYIITEFFGWIQHYFGRLESAPFWKSVFAFLLDLYYEIRVYVIFVLRGTQSVSIFIVSIIILGTIIFIFGCYFFLFRYFKSVSRIINKIIKVIKIFYFFVKKLISTKIFQAGFFIFSFSLVLIIDYLFFSLYFEDIFILMIIGQILNYIILIIQLFLFIKGINYYKIENKKQNYFLLSIAASSTIMFFYFVIGYYWFFFYLLHAKVLTYLIFFNLIIIQNTYFKDLMKKNKIYLILCLVSLIFFGAFYSLSKLSFG